MNTVTVLVGWLNVITVSLVGGVYRSIPFLPFFFNRHKPFTTITITFHAICCNLFSLFKSTQFVSSNQCAISYVSIIHFLQKVKQVLEYSF